VSNLREGKDEIAYGFLRRDGVTVALTGGTREVERDPATGCVRHIRMTATDREGRLLQATGVPVSRIVLNRHTFIDHNSLIRWDLNGAEAWGEDQDMWPVHRWARYRREAAAQR